LPNRTLSSEEIEKLYAPLIEEVRQRLKVLSGGVVAALNVGAPKFRLGTRLDTAGRIRSEIAFQLSRRLGWAASPFSPA